MRAKFDGVGESVVGYARRNSQNGRVRRRVLQLLAAGSQKRPTPTHPIVVVDLCYAPIFISVRVDAQSGELLCWNVQLPSVETYLVGWRFVVECIKLLQFLPFASKILGHIVHDSRILINVEKEGHKGEIFTLQLNARSFAGVGSRFVCAVIYYGICDPVSFVLLYDSWCRSGRQLVAEDEVVLGNTQRA